MEALVFTATWFGAMGAFMVATVSIRRLAHRHRVRVALRRRLGDWQR